MDTWAEGRRAIEQEGQGYFSKRKPELGRSNKEIDDIPSCHLLIPVAIRHSSESP